MSPSTRVVIIGTGFAGLCMAIRLKQAGIHTFTVLEKAKSLGGTWRDNDYPGAACDVQSHLYSFSFEKNPRWSRMFARQAEIRSYLEHCADKYALRPHLRFEAEVTSSVFDEGRGVWTVTLASGEQMEADVVVTATGGLSRPSYPDIPGLSTFRGKLFHSARWDHEYPLAGKKVGVIGTGASAIQFVPQIAPRVQALRVFQRTPPWILPKPDRVIGRLEQALYAIVPFLQWIHRLLLYWFLELRVLGFAVNPKLMALPQSAALRYLEKSVADPALRKKLTPNYTIGCKRVLISNDYFEAVQRPNVDVVDAGIREITPDGVLTLDGRLHELDAIILGTGFQASESVAPFEVRGRGGLDLNEHWKDGAEAYLGTTVAGFPNLFLIVGPNTGLGHSSMVFMIESQVAYVMSALRALRRNGARSMDVREDVQTDYNRRLHARLDGAVWSSGCTSWYRTRTGKNTTLWPTFTFTFRMLTRSVTVADYRFAAAEPALGRLPAPATDPPRTATAA